MVIFGDEGSMVERFVEIGARVFLDGTLVASGFSANGPRYSWRFRVLKHYFFGLTSTISLVLALPLASHRERGGG